MIRTLSIIYLWSLIEEKDCVFGGTSVYPSIGRRELSVPVAARELIDFVTVQSHPLPQIVYYNSLFLLFIFWCLPLYFYFIYFCICAFNCDSPQIFWGTWGRGWCTQRNQEMVH